MKKKNENSTGSNAAKSQQKKKPVAINMQDGVTDKVKAKSGRGIANEGTNVSYEEER